MELDTLLLAREAIDKIDGEMLRLFAARMEEVSKVAAYKAAHGLPILDEGREAALLERNLARLPFADPIRPYYEAFLKHTISLSRQYQAQRLGGDTVAYQGIPGAFSHIALRRLFPLSRALEFPTFGEIFQAVENGVAAYGILPFENSQAGDVSEVLDLCLAHPGCFICRMYDLPVEQNLLALPGVTLSQVKRVASHPQALRQCADFLRPLSLKVEPAPNTAMAAQHVAQAADPSLAAIASRETAELYGLSVLCPDISGPADNATRFIVISRELPERGDRFCLLFTLGHESGTLAKAMESIAKQGYNMECIKSRPLPRAAWTYYFYAELMGSPSAALMDALSANCNTLRLLGRYERG